MSEPTRERLLVERDALKAECVRLMDECAMLRGYIANLHQAKAALRKAEEEVARLRAERACGKPIDCGATCYLDPGHAPPCLCSGDMDGPGSCPA